MALFVTVDDFVGEIAIPKDSYSELKLQDYIDRYEKRLLINLLGAAMYSDFRADYVDANPTANQFSQAKYTAIYNEILLDESDCILIHSEGISEMLRCFIYFFYVRDQKFKNTIGGPVKNKQADAEEADYMLTNINDIYNRGVTSWNWIQYYIDCYNPENYDYNNFNGRIKNFNSII